MQRRSLPEAFVWTTDPGETHHVCPTADLLHLDRGSSHCSDLLSTSIEETYWSLSFANTRSSHRYGMGYHCTSDVSFDVYLFRFIRKFRLGYYVLRNCGPYSPYKNIIKSKFYDLDVTLSQYPGERHRSQVLLRDILQCHQRYIRWVAVPHNR